jgi:ABC-type Zn2+ transport system substrate-binding protein/surface adhesin
MADSDSPWLRHHRQRWLRHDAHLWIRPDAARTDPAVINPTLARKPDAAQAAFEAEIEAAYQRLAMLRKEVADLRTEAAGRARLRARARTRAKARTRTSHSRWAMSNLAT